MATTKRKPMRCLWRTNQGTWCQESYMTSSMDAGRRARQLQATGRFHVTVSAMGLKVTPWGTIKITMVDIRPKKVWNHSSKGDTWNLPTLGWELGERTR